MTSQAAIAVNRFGLGARPDTPLPPHPRAWLLDQLERFDPRPPAWASFPPIASIAGDYIEDREAVRSADEAGKQTARRQLRRDTRALYVDAIDARTTAALDTPAPFAERLVHFWANHFAVSADKPVTAPFVGAFERDAIRPHLLGRFADMLIAVEQHAAMQLYLDQTRSIGPASRLAARATSRNPGRNPGRKTGLNENLAREILELHTLGADGGYTQADVTEFARALTGWSIGGLGRGGRDTPQPGAFVFRPALHEPGPRRIMGRHYAQPGAGQAEAILRDLTAAPATARHIATKLARHFVADSPPATLIDRLAGVFAASGGDLPTLYRALVEAPESWTGAATKFKTPWEWLISSLRGVGLRASTGAGTGIAVAPLMQQLGQPVWRPPSPAGFDDVAAAWAAPDALMRRVEVTQRIAARMGDDIDPRALATKLLPGGPGEATLQAIIRADSVPTGVALLLVSPAFQRR